jgi:hypothetical protein
MLNLERNKQSLDRLNNKKPKEKMLKLINVIANANSNRRKTYDPILNQMRNVMKDQ